MAELKTILFLSGMDFKEKSIQVIRKTPTAYAQAGWRVRYLVWRDPCHPDYAYEAVVQPPGVEVHRFEKPFSRWPRVRGSKLLSRLASLLAIFQLAWKARKLLVQESSQVIYGYEVFGVLALHLLRILHPQRALRVVRFQGVSLFQLTLRTQGRWALLKSHWQALLAYLLPADLCIMTNDGTRGLQRLTALRSPLATKTAFWPNGVDREVYSQAFPDLPAAPHYLLTSCRLVEGKGLYSCLAVVELLVNRLSCRDFLYVVAGGGPLLDKLQALTRRLGIEQQVFFTGPIVHERCMQLLQQSSACLLTYDYSNVGNPLLEALSQKKPVFTLDREDTKEWIRHGENGFLYEPTAGWELRMAADLKSFLTSEPFRLKLQAGLEKSKVWSWTERFACETSLVESLLIGRHTSLMREGRPGLDLRSKS